MNRVPAVIKAAERQVNPDQQTAALRREQAFADEDRWIGFVRAEPGAWSGWHHHGGHDTYFYVLDGHIQLEFESDGILHILDSGPGDFVHVPSQGIHRERAAPGHSGELALVRIGTGPTVINLEGPSI